MKIIALLYSLLTVLPSFGQGQEVAEFASFNFKLVVVNELIELGYFRADIVDLKKQHWRRDNYSYEPIPEIEMYFKDLKLTEDQLNQVRELTFDGGNEIYSLLIPNWDGEDSQFDISSISDISKLKNLENVQMIAMVYSDDVQLLTSLEKLKKIYWFDLDSQIENELMSKGVIIE